MKIIARNKKASYLYFLLEQLEVGIVLTGSEIKSIRANKVNINEAYVILKPNNAQVLNMHISAYSKASAFNVTDPTRSRVLLMHKKEITKWILKQKQQKLTVVVTKVYFNSHNLVKLEIALARGKKLHDKRETIKQRNFKREMARKVKKIQE